MCKFLNWMPTMISKQSILAASLLMLVAAPASANEVGYYGVGKSASAAEIAGWDIDIRPDGAGLPVGSGSGLEGEELYTNKCAHCHGTFGEGEGRWPVLAGGEDTLTLQEEGRPEKTVGSYWPYTSTLFDYIYRAMPYTAPHSLSADDTYAITAYVLYLNDLIDQDTVVDQGNLADIRLPNEANFYMDPRPDTNNVACMSECREPDSIKILSAISGVTPVGHFQEDADSPAASHSAVDLESINVVATGGISEEEHNIGQEVYQANCAACHQVTGAGMPPVFPALAGNAVVNGSPTELVSLMLNGRSGTAMASFAHLSDDELGGVMSYIRSAWGNSAEPILPPVVASQR